MLDRPQLDRILVGERHVRGDLQRALFARALQQPEAREVLLVGRYGPSVMTGTPPARRTSLALAASASPYAPSSSPVSRYLLLNSSCLAIAACRSRGGIAAHFSWFP